MRLFLFLISVNLIGCSATQDSFRGCKVFEDIGGKSTPKGLIILPSGLANELIQQLPDDLRNQYVCWYTFGDKLIVTEKHDPNSFVYGYSFIKQNGVWLKVDESPSILAVPRFIN